MLPVLVAAAATLVNVVSILREFRKTAAFVIAAAVWACFIWLYGLLFDRLGAVSSGLSQAESGASSASLSGLVVWFDKIEYLFPIYTVFSALGLYFSIRVAGFIVHWLLKLWETVPFKGGGGS